MEKWGVDVKGRLLCVLMAWGCGPGALPNTSQLFVKSSDSDAQNGSGILIAVEANLSCSAFKELLEFDLLADRLAPQTGALISLSYALTIPSENEPWLGVYAPSASIIRGENDDDSQQDTGSSGSEPVSGTEGRRTATSSWVEPGGVWIQESAGLRVEVEEYSSKSLKMRIEHIWAKDNVTVENCGNLVEETGGR